MTPNERAGDEASAESEKASEPVNTEYVIETFGKRGDDSAIETKEQR